jgi:two-component system, OmpR family, response regulator ArlR
MSGSRVLLVEDEPALARGLFDLLRVQGFDVRVAADGQEGLDAALSGQADLILLDIMLPKVNGYEICRAVRAHGLDVPILMLTAKGQEADVVLGLNLGADDYITKPFALRELVARVRAVLRRGGANDRKPPAATSYSGQHLIADFDAISVRVNGAQVRLTRREFELLRYLVENRNRVISRDRLLERVWGWDDSVETRSVDVHIGRLRSKLGIASRQIETVIGLGYRFID